MTDDTAAQIIADLTSQLSTLRDETIEMCAKVADEALEAMGPLGRKTCGVVAHTIASSIRALTEKN